MKDFFSENKEIIYWRFEVIYSFEFEISKTIFDTEINQSPKDGSCSIDPKNGTMMTLFSINCSNWFDQDQIKDYLFYGLIVFFEIQNNFIFLKGWRKDQSNRMMLAHSTQSVAQLRLPASTDQTSILHIIVQIRDTFDSITEFTMSSIIVLPDFVVIKNLIDNLQNPNNNSLIQLLANGDQNTVGQIITSLAQIFNEMNGEMIKNAALSKYFFKSQNNDIFFYRWYSVNKYFNNVFE